MKRTGSSDIGGGLRSSRNAEHESNERDLEERARRRAEWRRLQEREREHEELRRKKIEEYERNRRAQEREKERKNTAGRSSYTSHAAGRCRSASLDDNRREESKPGTSTNSVMSEKCQSSSNNARLFQGPEGTKIELEKLRHIKVAIHRKVATPETNVELQRDILDPEAVKVKRRDGEGSKPIFEREELKKSVVPVVSEPEERRTVLSLPPLNEERTERRQRSSRKRTASPTSLSERTSARRHIDNRGSRYESSRRNVDGLTDHKSHKPADETDRGRSKDRRSGQEIDDRRYRSAPRRRSRDVSRDRRERRRVSHSAERESQRSETRNRSSRELLPRRDHRDHRERSRDDSRERRNRDDRSRERRMQVPPHHYAEAMPVPLYYETFPPRPIMIGPMIPMGGQIPMGRGGMRPLMGPMRPPYPPRFFPPEMYRSNPHPNPQTLKKEEAENAGQAKDKA